VLCEPGKWLRIRVGIPAFPSVNAVQMALSGIGCISHENGGNRMTKRTLIQVALLITRLPEGFAAIKNHDMDGVHRERVGAAYKALLEARRRAPF